jgi:hypothetical protein
LNYLNVNNLLESTESTTAVCKVLTDHDTTSEENLLGTAQHMPISRSTRTGTMMLFVDDDVDQHPNETKFTILNSLLHMSLLSPPGKVVQNFTHWGKLSVRPQIISYLPIPIWGAIDKNAPNSMACSQIIFGRVFAREHGKPTRGANYQVWGGIGCCNSNAQSSSWSFKVLCFQGLLVFKYGHTPHPPFLNKAQSNLTTNNSNNNINTNNNNGEEATSTIHHFFFVTV